MINTRFWSDGWVVELDPLERYLYLYLLTNEHTNIAGVYELPIRVMAFESGIDKEMLPKMLKRFSEKIVYTGGWVAIKNFQKHQSSSSEKVKRGIEIEMSKIPPKIMEKIEKLYVTDMVSKGIIYPNSNSNSNSNTQNEQSSKDVGEMIYLFKDVNPSYENLFKRKNQREPIKRLLKKYGREKLTRMIEALPKTNEMKYAPTITTPIQLEDKLGQLIAFAKKEKSNQKWSVI